MTLISGFTIRVYGLLEQDGKVLAIRERIAGEEYLKFPGGGLEFGEGLRDCLKREFQEELSLGIEVGEHLYTCDHFVQSKFRPDRQVLAVYYLVKAAAGSAMGISDPDILGIEWLEKKDAAASGLDLGLDRIAFLELLRK